MKFIKWYWSEIDTSNKRLIIILGWLIFNIIDMLVFHNLISALILIISGASLIILGVSYYLYKIISKEWIRYKNYVKFEEDKVINALKGVPKRRDNPYSNKSKK